MAYQCIGQSRAFNGKLTRCTQESEIPTGKWNVFLCSQCSGSRPNQRPKLEIVRDELEKPNFDDDTEFHPARASQEDVDLGYLDKLDELDLS
jgi:hypothetical protein